MQPQTVEADITGAAFGRHRQAMQDAGNLSEVCSPTGVNVTPPGRSEKQLSTNHRLQFCQLVTNCRGRQIENFYGSRDITEACRFSN